jgi:ribonuclease BN (tRNA processing enzyme)
MVRNIHPIGQGGFISEYFPITGKTFIYDCGTSTNIGNPSYLNTFLDSSLSTSDIECVYISHFDEDHVSLIPNLVNGRNIKRVVIPFATEETKNLINALFNSKELASIFTNPQQMFGVDTQVVEVQELDENYSGENEVPEIETITSDSKYRGFGWKIGREDWEYIFYNVKSDKRYQIFINLCSKYNIDIKKLSDMNYVIKNRDTLKAIYNQIQGGINQNSLIVYSGPLGKKIRVIFNWHLPLSYPAPSCLFTGDYDCTHLAQVINLLKKDWIEKIGLLQLPHHGAKNN